MPDLPKEILAEYNLMLNWDMEYNNQWWGPEDAANHFLEIRVTDGKNTVSMLITAYGAASMQSYSLDISSFTGTDNVWVEVEAKSAYHYFDAAVDDFRLSLEPSGAAFSALASKPSALADFAAQTLPLAEGSVVAPAAAQTPVETIVFYSEDQIGSLDPMPIFGYRGGNLRLAWTDDASPATTADYEAYGFDSSSTLTSVLADGTDGSNLSGLSVLAMADTTDAGSETGLPDHLPSNDSNQDSSQESGQGQGNTQTQSGDAGDRTQATAESGQENASSGASLLDSTAGRNQTDVESTLLAFNMDDVRAYDLLASGMHAEMPADAGPAPSEFELRLAGGGVILFNEAETAILKLLT